MCICGFGGGGLVNGVGGGLGLRIDMVGSDGGFLRDYEPTRAWRIKATIGALVIAGLVVVAWLLWPSIALTAS